MPTPKPLRDRLVRRHLRFGWWSLLIFLALGLLLEALHGFKIGGYLDASQSSRRLMWTLAHAHGTLLSILNIIFACTLGEASAWSSSSLKLASRCWITGSLLLPGGFFLSGVVTYGGDPGAAIGLVAVGGLVLLLAVFLTARGFSAALASKPDASD
ncbi:MAG: hypothetical protein K0U98_18525 [Deltaproteobacteria bacterium]|nr:hypothetical protein [Deltaproteobacteria bacterium]